jgi:hypothetical protein
MKLVHGLTLVTLVATGSLATASTWLGCSSSPSTTTSQDGGTTTGTDGGGGNPPVDSGSTTPTDGGGTTIAQTCTAYCAAIQTTCTGNDQQYLTTLECMNACAFFPPGSASDTTGDTLGCRIYHTGLAAMGTPNPHCWHAGPYGAGVCGSNCENFCALAVDWCSPDAGFTGTPPYDNNADCMTACNGFTSADGGADPEAFSANGPPSGNTLDCREYHLGNALNSAPGAGTQGTHCPHAAAALDGGPCN